MHFKLLFPSLYIGAHDLKGKDAVLTIRRVVKEELKTAQGTETKPVVYFEELKSPDGKDKRMVLNKTNAMTIAEMYGPEVNNWTGKRITIFPTRVQSFGKEADALRIRPVPPPATATATETKES